MGPPSFEVWCSLAIHLFEQHLECTDTAMALAVLTVEVDGKKCPKNCSAGCFSFFFIRVLTVSTIKDTETSAGL